jgi:hypothetical protein
LYTYQWLTGRDITAHYDYPKEFDSQLKKTGTKKQGSFMPLSDFTPEHAGESQNNMMTFFISLLSFAAVVFALSRKRKATPLVLNNDKML